jgi:REP element-mobilizing transposase RayT
MCTFERRQYFKSAALANDVRWAFLRSGADWGVEITAYCFMPDHAHALLTRTSPDSDAREFLRLFRQQSGFRHRQLYGHRLWQDGYFDRHLRSEDATLDVVSYIVCNPVRAGICATPQEYPFSGSSAYPLSEILVDVQGTPTTLG